MVKPWLKKIFRAEVVGVVIAVIGLMLALPQFQKDALAELTIRKQTSEDNPTIQITDNQTDVLAKALPILTNTSKYSLNNFSLQYRFTNLPTSFVASDDYTVKTRNGSTVMTYNSNTLYAHATAPMPVQNINIEGNDQSIDYTINYTFDGAPEIGEIKGSIILTTNQVPKPGHYRFHLDMLERINQSTSTENTNSTNISKREEDEKSFWSWGEFAIGLIIVGLAFLLYGCYAKIISIKVRGIALGDLIELKLPEWLAITLLSLGMAIFSVGIPVLIGIYLVDLL